MAGEGTGGEDDGGNGSSDDVPTPAGIDRLVGYSERVMQAVELVAGFVLVVLFAIGVFDLAFQIVQ